MGSYVKQYRRRPDSVGVRIEAFILAKGGPVWSSEVYAHIGQLAAAEVKYLNKTGRIIQLARSLYAPPDFNATPDEIALMVAAKPRRNPNACGDDFVPTKALRRRWSRLEPFAHLIGVQGDEKVGRLAGVSKQAVHDYRKRYGIASSRPYTVADRASVVADRFGHDSDADIARECGLSPVTVGKYRRVAGIQSPVSTRIDEVGARVSFLADGLGRINDHALSRRAGVSCEAIRRARIGAGIAPMAGQNSRGGVGAKGGKIAPFVHMLGKVPDREIATLSGVSVAAVCLTRNGLGIAPVCGRKTGGTVRRRGPDSLMSRVESLVISAGRPVRNAEIIAELNMKPPSVASTLIYLCRHNRLQRIGIGLYTAPDNLSHPSDNP